jgi:hypothetical protein
MFIKVFDGSSAEEVETKVNSYLEKSMPEGHDFYNLVQTESFVELSGQLERSITMTLIFTDKLYDFSEDDILEG